MFGTIFQLHSQGYIVPNGVTYAGYSGVGYEIDVISHPPYFESTAFIFEPLPQQGPNVFSFQAQVDESIRVFFVSPNDPVSLQPILSQSYTELLFSPTYVFDNHVPFYVGLYTGFGYPDNGIYDDPVFGWAQLVNNNGVIELLDSALEYGGGGIYAGTQTIIPIPEPGALALAALGTLLLGFRRLKLFRKLNF
jgi:hypothetical protein